MTNKVDIVNNPPHYTDGKIEVIEFIEIFNSNSFEKERHENRLNMIMEYENEH